MLHSSTIEIILIKNTSIRLWVGKNTFASLEKGMCTPTLAPVECVCICMCVYLTPEMQEGFAPAPSQEYFSSLP